MKLKIKTLNFSSGKPVCMINVLTAKEMSLHVANRVSLKKGNKKLNSIVDIISGNFVKKNEIAVSNEIIKNLNLKNNSIVEVSISPRPNSINIINKAVYY